MQNKGFVRLLAAALMLICLFYLSFTFVTNNYDKKAKAYANGDDQEYYNFMDSVGGEKVWMGYTLRECREKEIGLGLDLKGGMNVQLEVSVADVLRALSDYNTNENFNKAIELSRQRQARSGENFLKIFQEEFEKLDANARLAGIFSTYDLKDRISSSATNDEVVKVLQEEVNSAIDNSFNVLRSRIDRFGVVQPNIQRLDVEGRILVELPGVKEPERVRKLLQGSANLEFWETYKYAEVAPYLEQANAVIRDMNRATEEANTTMATEEVKAEEVVAEVTETTDSVSGTFVPNDCILDGDCNRLMLITGPNMAGKSTYIRQTALLVILAQAGSFIPADYAEIGLVDRIFTRIGAADDLSRNQSTFMVEMVETANILRNATPRSLVILDEIGRGTSTFDGLSIAWSVAEYLHDDPRCRTQFATHYHELTELASTRRGVNNYNVAVREYGEDIIFLRQILPGSSDRSYGIHVAKLAGVPSPVLERAKVILELLEKSPGTPHDAISALPRKTVKSKRKSDESDDAIQLRLL